MCVHGSTSLLFGSKYAGAVESLYSCLGFVSSLMIILLDFRKVFQQVRKLLFLLFLGLDPRRNSYLDFWRDVGLNG